MAGETRYSAQQISEWAYDVEKDAKAILESMNNIISSIRGLSETGMVSSNLQTDFRKLQQNIAQVSAEFDEIMANYGKKLQISSEEVASSMSTIESDVELSNIKLPRA